MNPAASQFSRRILLFQALLSTLWTATLAVLAPSLLRLDAVVLPLVLRAVATSGVAALALTTALAATRLRRERFVLRTLALGSAAVEPEDLTGIASLPRSLAKRFVGSASLLTLLLAVPGIRPEKLDAGRTVSLLILAVTLLAAASVPHFVVIRSAVSRLFELSPIEPVTQLLEDEELRGARRLRGTGRLIFAMVVPALLIGVGTVLITHAHLRSFIEESRTATAVAIARTSLEPGPSTIGRTVGRDDAIAAARRAGYTATWRTTPVTEVRHARDTTGRLATVVPLEDGSARILYAAELDPQVITGGVALALSFAVLAAWLALAIGGGLAADLDLTTRRVRLLGTENVMLGAAKLGHEARFVEVRRLEQAIEALAERFRVFAAAQERALEARERAQRLRGLLFASVSHDLKSPLNAILGFAALLEAEDLLPAQRESLELITTRGRELLALIETILDAARVEAGQLHMESKPTDVALLLREAVKKARELTGQNPEHGSGDIVIEASGRLPKVPLDPGYVNRAIAVIVAHALRSGATDRSAGLIRLRATVPSPGGKLRVDVEHNHRGVSAAELSALFARQASDRGRGLTLGLSLARAVFELHGGRIDVEGSPDGAPIVRCFLPLTAPSDARTIRRSLSSYPTLG